MANNAEHTFRVLWIALILAKHEKSANTERILKLTLVHDLDELRTGDADGISRHYVKRDAVKAVEDIFEGSVLEEEFVELFKELHEEKTLEAQIVKDADHLEPDLEMQEMSFFGNGMAKGFISTKLHGYAETFHTESAKRMFNTLQTQSPDTGIMKAMMIGHKKRGWAKNDV